MGADSDHAVSLFTVCHRSWGVKLTLLSLLATIVVWNLTLYNRKQIKLYFKAYREIFIYLFYRSSNCYAADFQGSAPFTQKLLTGYRYMLTPI